jgi:nucleoside-diphosphate-sugar epimerase
MILVTGATGYLGHRVVRQLLGQGKKVRAMVIENDPFLNRLDGLDCEVVVGDITKPETLVNAVSGVKTVIHCAAVIVSNNPDLFHRINYEGTRNLVEKSVEAGVEHFIFISAAAADYKMRTDYGDSKLESERLMEKAGKTNFTIVRPTIIYSKDGGHELNIYVDLMRKIPIIFPLVGSGSARKSPVYVEDVADGICRLVDKPVSYGKTYNFSGGSDVSMKEFTKLWGEAHGVDRIIVPIPMPLVWLAVKVFGMLFKNPPLDRNRVLGIINDANFSNEEAVRDIGYAPTPLLEGLEKAFQS